ncbi:MAG: NEW3 domain-containing protein [Caldilineales bacterium]|nr:NEW3 domain-containing protein [Caldilineales bacterium]MDW8319376.1 NEW3 domain-containing protein [Anaerolineae bacterium]
MRRLLPILVVTSLLLALAALPAAAQTPTPQPTTGGKPLVLFTAYPSQIVGLGETVTFNLKLRAGERAQVVQLEMKELPAGWTATFRGGARNIQAAYVEPGTDTNVDLRLEPSAQVTSGTYRFVVLARGEGAVSELPLTLTVREKVPARLSLTTDLPVIRGPRTSTFRYNVTLKNEGDEDLTVNLFVETAPGFAGVVKVGGNEVTSVPVDGNQTKTLSVEVKAFQEVPAGAYPMRLRADAGDARAQLDLAAEVTGQVELAISAPDGRLSGRAYAGREEPLTIYIQNLGTAPARDITLSSSQPTGWTVEFDPKRIDEIGAGKQVEVTAKIKPSDKAVAGDYIVTVRAQPESGANKSADFRITVLTSTLWGVVGVALIAVAVAVVGLAVMRFGRR